MKHIFALIAVAATLTAHAQKTTREVVSQAKGVTITKSVIENTDGTKEINFYMSGQNAQYSHITDIVSIKYGTAQEIDELLTECRKFLPEKSGTSIEYKGNTIGATGRNQVVLFGSGNDSSGNVLLNEGAIAKLQEGLRKHL